MGPEVWVGIAAVFVSGGAVGAAGTLLAQWILKRVTGDLPPAQRQFLPDREADLLRLEVAEMSRHVRDLDARLYFQEQMLGGSLQATPPRLGEGDPRDTPGSEEDS